MQKIINLHNLLTSFNGLFIIANYFILSSLKTKNQKIYIVKKTTQIGRKRLRMYFKSIRKTEHYKEYHERNVPWSKVIEIILTTKNRRKKGDKIEIKTKNYYIIRQLKNNVLWVINAKQTG